MVLIHTNFAINLPKRKTVELPPREHFGTNVLKQVSLEKGGKFSFIIALF